MSNVMLMYHPVKKEVRFMTNDNGGFNNIPFSDCPKLQEYSPDQGEFLLQNQGHKFFDDILETFLGLEHYKIIFKGTKLDYEDFVKMVNHYNKYRNKNIINIGDFIELPEVASIYESISKFSYETSCTFDSSLKDQLTRSIFETQRMKLAEKIKELDKNNVNLCMVGTYSSGKSTFINAIIGKRILPESINSETAKMFKILNDKEPSITFVLKKGHQYLGDIERLNWNRSKNIFVFDNPVSSNELKNKINTVLNTYKDSQQHEQMHNILKALNDLPNRTSSEDSFLDGIIEVRYPIELSNEINFTLFDTPGTDSNSGEHLLILKDALKKQTNSILVVLYSPVNMEGTGNSILYRLLEESKNDNDEKVTIDLSRSLHIINQADRYNDEELKGLIKTKIKTSLKAEDIKSNDENSELEYDLSKKRVFYVSSKGAYCAKAILNKVQDESDDKFIRRYSININEDQYFKLNKLADAEIETDELISSSIKAIDDIDAIDNEKVRNMKKLHINSGMYAVEQEIVKYAEKYALAVKAKGLYSGVLHMIDGVKNAYVAIESQAGKSEKEISGKISVMRNEMELSINNVFDQFCRNISINTSKMSEINEINGFITKLNRSAEKEADRMLKFAIKKHKFEDRNYQITEKLSGFAIELEQFYKKQRKEILDKQMRRLKLDIKKIIIEFKSSGIEEELLKEILNIHDSKVPASVLKPFVMDQFIKKRKSLFLKVDTKVYKEAVVQEFLQLTAKQYDAYLEEVEIVAKKQGKEMIDEIAENIAMLSGSLERLINEKNIALKMQQDAKLILDIIYNKQQELDAKIWGA